MTEKDICYVCLGSEGELKNYCGVCNAKIHESCIIKMIKNNKDNLYTCGSCNTKPDVFSKEILDTEYLNKILMFVLHVFSYIIHFGINFLICCFYDDKPPLILALNLIAVLLFCFFMILFEFVEFINSEKLEIIFNYLFYLNLYLIINSLLYSVIGCFASSIIEENVLFTVENIFSVKYVEYGVWISFYFTLIFLSIFGLFMLVKKVIKPGLYNKVYIPTEKKFIRKKEL